MNKLLFKFLTMKSTFLLALFFFCVIAQAQIVDIPDANFKNALVNTLCVDIDGDYIGDDDVDTNDDGEIQVSEAEAVLWLNVIGMDISSLEGVQSFTNLIRLYCQGNGIIDIDVSQHQNLVVLDCQNNEISSLDVSHNPNLEWLVCEGNYITSLDLSYNPNLKWLIANANHLTSLNVKNGNNHNMMTMTAYNNPNLNCIEVDNGDYTNSQTCGDFPSWCKDDWAEYSEDCTLGTEEFNTFNFNIYPNPVNHSFNIHTQFPIEKVQIYSLQGILIKEANTNNMNVSELPSGIYFVKASNNGRHQTKKLIKK